MVDAAGAQALQAARIPSRRVDHRKQFSLLIVRGDGARVLRVNFPQRLPAVLMMVLTIAACGMGVLLGDWWKVREKMQASAHLFQQIEDQQTVIDTSTAGWPSCAGKSEAGESCTRGSGAVRPGAGAPRARERHRRRPRDRV